MLRWPVRTAGFYGRPLVFSLQAVLWVTVLGATPRVGPALWVSRSICGLQWHGVATPSCLWKEEAGEDQGSKARTQGCQPP